MEDLTRQRKERGQNARRTGVWGIIYNGVYAVSQLVALGMLVRYVGKEPYGLWMTIIAIASWMPLANLGQQSALLTRLSAAAHTDRDAAQRILSASTLLVTAVSTLLLPVLLLSR